MEENNGNVILTKTCNLFDSNHNDTVANGHGGVRQVENNLDNMEMKRMMPSSKSDSVNKYFCTSIIINNACEIN